MAKFRGFINNSTLPLNPRQLNPNLCFGDERKWHGVILREGLKLNLFTFRSFPFDHSRKGKEGKDLSPFPKLLKPFPVANYSFPGKGKDPFLSQERILSFPKITETFPSCSFPKIADTFPSCNQGKDLSTPCLLQLRWQLRHFQCQFQAFQFLW